jgi:small subunit ribosomal protein S1
MSQSEPHRPDTLVSPQVVSAEVAPASPAPHPESNPTSSPVQSAPSAADPDDAETGPSDEFRRALEAYERRTRAAAAKGIDVTAGSKVRGTIVSIGDEQTLVDFGGRSEGVIETRHLRDESGTLRHAVGDALELWVVRADDQVELGLSMRTDPHAALEQVREAQRAGIPVTGRVVGRNAGGLEVDISGVRGFCPVSQIEISYCGDPSVYVGRTLEFAVTNIDTARGNAVLSRRTLLMREQAQKAEQFVASLKPGAELDGTVARLEEFGAFVDLGGVDGLIHVSEIRHERTGHPRDALTAGQRVHVRVLRVETGKGGKPRIALSIKASQPDPWIGVEARFQAGARVRGAVVRLTDFGAFVNLAPGIDGLVHVSEAAAHQVKHVKDVFTVGQEVEAVVRAVDPVKKRISLSVREALGASGGVSRREPAIGDLVEGVVAGIKPYGLFVDLAVYGPRERGLVPSQETGTPRGTDLARHFKVGDRVQVEVIELREGKIRASLERARRREESRNAEAFSGDRPGAPAELTSMAIALRAAMEKKKAKESGKAT